MKNYSKPHNSISLLATFILPVLVFLVTAPAFAGISGAINTYTFYPVLDYGSEDETGDIGMTDIGDGGGEDWSYICELGAYQAWFGFDVSIIPDGETILSASFTASIGNETGGDGDYIPSSQRTVWYEPDDSWIEDDLNPGNMPADEFVGDAWDSHEWEWLTFNLDISLHDWGNDLVDDYITLMLTGPLSGAHECGEVDLSESDWPPYLEVVTTPEPATVALLGLGALSLIHRKK